MWTIGTRGRARRVAAAAVVGVLSLAGEAAAQQAPQTITLEQAIEIALERNPTLQTTINAAELDAITVRQQRMQFIPDVRLGSSTNQSYGRAFSQDEGRIINQSTQSLNASLSSSVVVFNGFANSALLAQARLNEAAGASDVVRAQQTVVFTVMSNYLSLIEQQEQLRVQENALQAQETLEAQIKAYVDAGARPISDLYQQQASTASARLALVQARRALELGRMALIRTLQLDPLGSYQFQVPELGTPDAPSSLDVAGLAEQALSRRADLAAAQASLSAAEQGVRVASASRLPSVSLSAGYNTGFTSANDAAFFDQLDQRRGGQLGLSFSLPVFDRQNSRLARERARIQVENAQIALANTRQTVAIEVRTAALDLQAAQEQLRQAEAQLRAAELALQASQQRYDVGASTLVELTQARSAQVRAASDLVSARYGLVFQDRLMEYYLGNLALEE